MLFKILKQKYYNQYRDIMNTLSCAMLSAFHYFLCQQSTISDIFIGLAEWVAYCGIWNNPQYATHFSPRDLFWFLLPVSLIKSLCLLLILLLLQLFQLILMLLVVMLLVVMMIILSKFLFRYVSF